MATMMKAANVPMFTSSAITSSETNPARSAVKIPTTRVTFAGVLNFLWISLKKIREQAVAGHGKEDPGLAVQGDEYNRCDTAQCADRNEGCPPGDPDPLQGKGNRGAGLEEIR
eukprot:TRINITY_DN16584_c0_g1_i1.p8 TRINITY_DN16584_c0_g1~~TRINITY_DN16584_c0_g1_i1.p8  ORF type:complete len:113 (+),score=2.11 TRINITY_DN16584_c0_g1_i1:667-1005(+)